jgi:hypothetical protein
MTKKASAEQFIATPGWRPSAVHPEAEKFPIMPGDVESLAEDMKTIGLVDDIMIDAAGVLIDGRTRLAACELAGIEPRFAVMNGEDVVQFIWSRNRKRRQMTQGQFAMVGALSSATNTLTGPGPKGGRSATTGVVEAARKASVNKQTMAKAFLVRDFCQDLVEDVRFGRITLDKAFQTAEVRKREQEWRENGIAQLRKIAPELAVRVSDGEITVDEGRKLFDEQVAREKDQRESVFLTFANVAHHGANFAHGSILEALPGWLKDEASAQDLLRYFPGGVEELREKMRAVKSNVESIEALLADIPVPRKKGTPK